MVNDEAKKETHPERISNIAPYVDRFDWKGTEFSAGPKD